MLLLKSLQVPRQPVPESAQPADPPPAAEDAGQTGRLLHGPGHRPAGQNTAAVTAPFTLQHYTLIISYRNLTDYI